MTGFMTPDDDCEEDCCTPECVKPVVDCSIDYDPDPNLLSWSVTNAVSAWIIKSCGSYVGISETRIDLTLTSRNGSGSIDTEPGCSYVLCAANECGEVSSLCAGPALQCNECYPTGKFMYGTLYSVSGIADSGTDHIEYYRISDGAHVATVKWWRSGFGVGNHSGYIPWDPEACCWEDYILLISASAIVYYEITVHVAHYTGSQNYGFPGVYWHQYAVNQFRAKGERFNCGVVENYAVYRRLRVDVAINNIVATHNGIGFGSYSYSPGIQTATVISNSYSAAGGTVATQLYFGSDQSAPACADFTRSLPFGVSVDYQQVIA